MLALGYNEYGMKGVHSSRSHLTSPVTQGGDFGYGVTRLMAYFYPKFCRGTHTNCARPNPPTMASNPALFLESQATPLTEAEKKGEARSKWFVDEGMGYYGQHSTKPQTLGYSLADSPVGLLAWVYEKLHEYVVHRISFEMISNTHLAGQIPTPGPTTRSSPGYRSTSSAPPVPPPH
jgi:hypothetical protein